jgi:phosphatidylethanolamine/phosphatidyl-N-methylethanolamine N-methyltransferase
MKKELFLQDFYLNFYTDIYSKSGLSRLAFEFTQKALESFDFSGLPIDANILEIGSGKGEHFPYVNHNFSKYLMIDLFAEPEEHPGKTDERVEWVQSDIVDFKFRPNSFDRVISTCVFHHLNEPFEVMQKISEIIKPGGLFSLFLPSDPGILTRLNRGLTVKPKSRRLGFYKYDLMASFEHHNHYWGLKAMLDEVFRDWDISRKYYPFGIKSANMSLFSIWQIEKPNK